VKEKMIEKEYMYSIFVQLLHEKNITSYRVAKDLNVQPSVFTDWKTGRSSPKTDKLQKIADYFGVTLEYLTGNSPHKRYGEVKEKMIEKELQALITEKFKSVKKFAQEINLPYTTVKSILNRGIENANIQNATKICERLNLEVGELLNGTIRPRYSLTGKVHSARLKELNVSVEDVAIIEAYHQRPELQEAVKILLGIKSE
jgi:transcriptional regulator with XRE-family HTH domain